MVSLQDLPWLSKFYKQEGISTLLVFNCYKLSIFEQKFDCCFQNIKKTNYNLESFFLLIIQTLGLSLFNTVCIEKIQPLQNKLMFLTTFNFIKFEFIVYYNFCKK